MSRRITQLENTVGLARRKLRMKINSNVKITSPMRFQNFIQLVPDLTKISWNDATKGIVDSNWNQQITARLDSAEHNPHTVINSWCVHPRESFSLTRRRRELITHARYTNVSLLTLGRKYMYMSLLMFVGFLKRLFSGEKLSVTFLSRLSSRVVINLRRDVIGLAEMVFQKLNIDLLKAQVYV